MMTFDADTVRLKLMPGSLRVNGELLSRKEITNTLRSIWNLSPALTKEAKFSPFLRSWEGPHLITQIKDGRIFYQQKWWVVVWNVTPERAYAAKQLLLSFRGDDTYGRYVIIRIKGEH